MVTIKPGGLTDCTTTIMFRNHTEPYKFGKIVFYNQCPECTKISRNNTHLGLIESYNLCDCDKPKDNELAEWVSLYRKAKEQRHI